MYRIWMGLNARMIMSALGTAIAGMVLTLHVWAFGQFGWPKSVKAKYNPPSAADTR